MRDRFGRNIEAGAMVAFAADTFGKLLVGAASESTALIAPNGAAAPAHERMSITVTLSFAAPVGQGACPELILVSEPERKPGKLEVMKS